MKNQNSIFQSINSNWVVYALVLMATFLRLIPHPWNFSTVIGGAVFAAMFLSKRSSLLLGFLSLLISDVILGLHETMLFTYGSMFIIVLAAQKFSNKRSVSTSIMASVMGSAIFFVVTNFGVWATSGMYEKNLQGLVNCFLMAIPFYKAQLAGDVLTAASLTLFWIASQSAVKTVSAQPILKK